MRYDDATCDRDHRWIDGQVAVPTPRVASRAGVEHAMCFDLFFKGAFSNV